MKMNGLFLRAEEGGCVAEGCEKGDGEDDKVSVVLSDSRRET